MLPLKSFLSAVVFTLSATVGTFAQTYEVLHTFGSSGTQPRNPTPELIRASDGNFYGTTSYGGDNEAGTIFKLTPGGAFSVVASFDISNGSYPRSGVIEGTNGNFYGTTFSGGANGYGTVFTVTPAGTITRLHSFSFNDLDPDGSNPYASLVLANDGNFYGTTTLNGTMGYGTIFKITHEGTLTTLASFEMPGFLADDIDAPLIQATDGNLYGTVKQNNWEASVVYKVTTNGTVTTFAEFTNDGFPFGGNVYGSLLQANDGNFYGTAKWAGIHEDSYGTVFKITPSGTLMRFGDFTGHNGSHPEVGITAGDDGNFYGSAGNVFRINAIGSITPLTTNIGAMKLVHADGKLYGATGAALFKITLPTGIPVIVTNPQSYGVTFAQQTNVTLTVSATGPGTLSYQWYAGLSGDTSSPLSGETNASYTTPSLSSPTSYWVRVSNQNGHENSANAHIWYVFYRDTDDDGYGDPSDPWISAYYSSYTNNTDCDDTRDSVHPGATEILANSIDEDCDGMVDEQIFYQDSDGDNYGNAAVSVEAVSAPPGHVTNNTDCNDNNSSINPGVTEICNGVDDDCDGSIDEGVTTVFYRDADGDTYGSSSVTSNACSVPVGYVAISGDCDDSNSSVNPAATEVCNYIDDDCDGFIDEGLTTVFYCDADGDTYGNPSVTTNACTVPTGYVANNTDCNDANGSIYPGATEIGNGLDDDCDGQADEGLLPAITTQPQSQTILLKGDALFTAQATGPSIYYQWRKNGLKISKATNATLSILNAGTTAAAAYTLVVTNTLGAVTSSVANLTISSDFSQVIPIAGKYNGLFYETNGVTHGSSGFFHVALKTNASFTGKLITEGDSPSFSGKMNIDGTATVTIKRTMLQKSNLVANLVFDLTEGTDSVTGSVNGLTWTAPMLAHRDVWYKNQQATNYTNYATMLLPGFSDSAVGPSGYGYGTVTVKTNGTVILAGLTGDARKWSQTVAISKEGQWPFYAQLYAVQRIFTNLTVTNVTKLITNRSYYLGSVLGWLTLTNYAPTGSVTSVKTSWTNSVYPNGFTNTATVLSSRYTAPATGTRAINSSNGLVTLSGGNLNSTILKNFTLSTANKIAITPTANSVMLTLAPKTGLIQGSFVHPVTGNKTNIAGVLLQQQKIGGGHFLGTNQAGSFYLYTP